MSKQTEIKKQVEYYLSDKNLKTDKFFNEKIRENKEVYLRYNNNLCFRDGWTYLTL